MIHPPLVGTVGDLLANQELPNNWYGVIGLLIFSVPSVLAAAAMWQTRRNRAKLGEVKEGVDNVKGQVTNGHETNLRDDVTEALKRLRMLQGYVENQPNQNDFRVLRQDVGQLQTGLRDLKQQFDQRQCQRQLPGDQETMCDPPTEPGSP
jgi:hypothetical protein